MAKIVILTKVLFIWVYNGLASILLHATITASINDKLSASLITLLTAFFLFMVFLPEVLWITWKSFRDWIKTGIENSDGKLNKDDLKDAGLIYVSLWSMRVFMGFSLAIIFGVRIPDAPYMGSLFGSFGIAGLTVIKNLMGK